MKNVLLPCFAVVFLAGGCSNEYSRNKGIFLSGCMQTVATEKICRCIFDELDKKYTIDDFKKVYAGQATPQFRESMVNATVTCSLR